MIPSKNIIGILVKELHLGLMGVKGLMHQWIGRLCKVSTHGARLYLSSACRVSCKFRCHTLLNNKYSAKTLAEYLLVFVSIKS